MPTARWKLSVICTLALTTTAGAALAQDRAPTTLPLRAVRLYEVGLGYFERTGKLGKGADLALPVPTSHLDDALKTLVILGAGGKASVAGVEFPSSVSPAMGRALAGLPEGDDSITYPRLLRSLKGAAVELRTERESIRGRLVDIVEPSQEDAAECVPAVAPQPAQQGAAPQLLPDPCAAARHLTLLVLTDRGEIRRLRSADVISVRPADPGFTARIGSGLDAISAQGSTVQKRLRVLATSSTDLTLGYVAETPVWRSSYRLVLDDKSGGVLQGWALVHNDTDEDWKQVKVELVNGQPESFLFPLAAPRYGRRDLRTPEEQLSTIPQLHGRTVDSLWGDEIGESFGAGGLGLSGVGEGGGGRGEGIGLGSIGTIGHGAGVGGESGSSALSIGNLAAIAPAEAIESGVLFRYTLPSPVDLRAHGSALVPFVQRPVGVRRIAHFERPGSPARAAARFRNDTGQTLPAGPIAFFADGGFAGEATVDRMTHDERRIIAFGNDLDVELTTHKSDQRDEPRIMVFEGDTLVEHFLRRHDVEYEIVNKSRSPRTVFLNLDYVQNSRVEGADELDYDTVANKAMAVFQVEGKKQLVRALKVEEGLSRRIPLAQLNAKNLGEMAARESLPADQRAALRAAAAELTAADQRRAEQLRVQASIAELSADLQRLRGHLAAAREGAADADPFVDRMLVAEDQLKSLRARAAQLGAERRQRTRAATAALSKLPRTATPAAATAR